MEETWRPAKGFENYFNVSNTGKVYSLRTNKILKQTKLKSGYLVINTRLEGRCGKSLSLRVHRLVADAFLDPPSDELLEVSSKYKYGKPIVMHLDNNKQNNHVNNLRWGTYQENTRDYMQTDDYINYRLTAVGVNHPLSKLSSDDIKYIAENYKPRCREFGARSLARMFNVNKNTIIRQLKIAGYQFDK